MEGRWVRRKALLLCLLKGDDVGLFRRKPKVEEGPERCPLCTERLPDGADECAMCGADLKALHPASEGEVRGPLEPV